ncbi:MAG: glycosyltransferase family 2 protein [Cyclobacteriaceae bacterium]|nr:glycosyltransferase family 2 protein [Cyclobacteriaceae bacterium HetDA_MAG_MS6]
MSDSPLVSIIMAVKDEEHYLAECLDSILAQTYPNWELIAVNDHSSDRTPEILTDYQSGNPRIKVYNGVGHKLIPTLQYGYDRSSGVLINRMDADDKMPKDKLEIMVREWMKYGKGTIVAGGTKHFVDHGEVGGGFLKYEDWLNHIAKTNTHYQEIYRECVIPSHCWLAHKDDFEAVGAFDPIVYPEDYDLCFRFYREKLNIVGIDHVLHFWRDHSTRISRTWQEYEDNRYFELKLKYFYELDRNSERPLVVWGAGKNGKDLMKLILEEESNVTWVCDNEHKIGKDIYNIRMRHFSIIQDLTLPQIIVAVAAPEARDAIIGTLNGWGKRPVDDFWFFT